MKITFLNQHIPILRLFTLHEHRQLGRPAWNVIPLKNKLKETVAVSDLAENQPERA